MDPNETLALIVEHVDDDKLVDAKLAAIDLHLWLAHGGFDPDPILAGCLSGQAIAFLDRYGLGRFVVNRPFDHDIEPERDGRHPFLPNLILCEVDQHYGMFVLRSPACSGSALISWEEWEQLVDDPDQAAQEYAYLDDSIETIFTTTTENNQ